MTPDATLKQTASGLAPSTGGWFVMNVRDARWSDKPGQRYSLPLTGVDAYEAESFFPMLGMAIRVMRPGEPSATHHWETEQEDFLVLAGEAVLICEGQERAVRQWDFVHCPPGTRHAFVGAGDVRPALRELTAVPEGWTVGLLLRRRDGRHPQRVVSAGDAGREHRLRALPSFAGDARSGRVAAGGLAPQGRRLGRASS
jgi:hypothetical protein